MSCMPDLTITSLVAVVAPRTGKIIKNGLSERKFATKWYTLCIEKKKTQVETIQSGK